MCEYWPRKVEDVIVFWLLLLRVQTYVLKGIAIRVVKLSDDEEEYSHLIWIISHLHSHSDREHGDEMIWSNIELQKVSFFNFSSTIVCWPPLFLTLSTKLKKNILIHTYITINRLNTTDLLLIEIIYQSRLSYSAQHIDCQPTWWWFNENRIFRFCIYSDNVSMFS